MAELLKCDCCEEIFKEKPGKHTCPTCKPIEQRYNAFVQDEFAKLNEGLEKKKEQWMKANGMKRGSQSRTKVESTPPTGPAHSGNGRAGDLPA